MKKGLKQLAESAIVFLIICGAAADFSTACLYDKCFSTGFGELHHDSMTIIMEVHGYTLTAMVGDVVLIRANNLDGAFNPRLDFVSPQGHLVATAGIPGTGVAEISTEKLQLEGNYSIVISDHGGNGRSDYYLSVQSANRPANARILQFDRMIRDTLHNVSEMKPYQFFAGANEIINIQMIAITEAIEPHLRLFGPDGSSIAGTADAEYAAIYNQMLGESGMYTIIADDDEGNELGEYFLILSRLPMDADGDHSGVPEGFVLNQNHPNPFNPRTTIGFSLLRSAFVRIDVYNILGENIRTLLSGRMLPGPHSVIWNGRNEDGIEVPSGIYFYRLQTDEFSQTRKMLLLK